MRDGYTSALVFNQNSVPARSVPLALSVTQVVTRVLDGCGAFICGSVYTLSLAFNTDNDRATFWTNFIGSHFVFLCVSVTYMFVYIPVMFIRHDIGKKLIK